MTVPPVPLAPGADHPFIGRNKEVAAFNDAPGRVRKGEGSIVMVSGPPGLGKTWTVEQEGRDVAYLSIVRPT